MIKKKLITPIILAGGSGTRLWPISRQEKPKQFLNIFNSKSLFQLTCLRCKNNLFNKPIIIVGEQHRFIVAEQLRKIGIKNANILLEPEPKNTTAAIAAGAIFSQKIKQDNPLLILPSDHYIKDNQEFLKLIKKVINYDIEDKLVCFGINPTSPEIKYGYILTNQSNNKKSILQKVKKFEEKPILAKAKELIKKKALWNSGMFLFNSDTVISEINSYYPDIYKYITSSVNKAISDMDFIRLDTKYFSKIKPISIDNAVFEKTKNSFIIPTNLRWNDLGTYNSLWDIGKKDKNKNVINGDVILDNVKNSYIYSDKKLVTVSNISDINVVATEDAVLITKISKTNEIKSLLNILVKKKRNELIEHSITTRPWGSFENIISNKDHKIKKLIVLPEKKLSLQSHNKRSEHWIVISGVANVTIKEKEFILRKNESTFIPVKTKHRLANTSKSELVIIEVQTGKYFGEDDIKRYNDLYGRIK